MSKKRAKTVSHHEPPIHRFRWVAIATFSPTADMISLQAVTVLVRARNREQAKRRVKRMWATMAWKPVRIAVSLAPVEIVK